MAPAAQKESSSDKGEAQAFTNITTESEKSKTNLGWTGFLCRGDALVSRRPSGPKVFLRSWNFSDFTARSQLLLFHRESHCPGFSWRDLGALG